MCKSIKRIVLVLLTSLMVIAPMSSFGVNTNQVIITYAAKSTKKSSTKKKSSSKKKSSTTKKKSSSNSSSTKKSTTKKSTTAANKNTTNNKYSQKSAVSSNNVQGNTSANSKLSVTGVWIPNTGAKYHSNSSCSRMKNPRNVSLEEAKRLGYKPCSKCMS